MSEEAEKAAPEETEEGGEDVEAHHFQQVGQTGVGQTGVGATEDDDDVEGHVNSVGQTSTGQTTAG